MLGFFLTVCKSASIFAILLNCLREVATLGNMTPRRLMGTKGVDDVSNQNNLNEC